MVDCVVTRSFPAMYLVCVSCVSGVAPVGRRVDRGGVDHRPSAVALLGVLGVLGVVDDSIMPSG